MHFVKQSNESSFAKYTIFHIISICATNTAKTSKLCWVLYNSIEKYKTEHPIINLYNNFYNNTKGSTRNLVKEYYNTCVWASKLKGEKVKDGIKGLDLTSKIDSSKLPEELSFNKEEQMYFRRIKKILEVH